MHGGGPGRRRSTSTEGDIRYASTGTSAAVAPRARHPGGAGSARCAVSARLGESAGFEAIYVGSYATAAARLGLPDAGLMGLREVVDHTPSGLPPSITSRSSRTPSTASARREPDFVIIARTDAGWLRAGRGLEDPIDRLLAYGAAGGDLVFPAGVPSSTIAAVAPRVPHSICMVDLPGSTVARDQAAGVKVVLYHALALYAAYRAVRDVLAAFTASGVKGALLERVPAEESEFNQFIGFARIRELAARHGLA